MHYTQLLDWDSTILGVPVARILSTQLDEKRLRQLLHDLKLNGVQLVYWASDSQDPISQQAALTCHGFLVDEKISYCIELKSLAPLAFPYPQVEVYTERLANFELESLAAEIALFSRFSRDPYLSWPQVHKLYTTWINNACKKIVAELVLVIRIHDPIVGMVVLADKQGRGDLSLLAVSPEYQGRGLAKHLVKAAQAWCLKQGYKISQVVTQKINKKACFLYERCGYKQEKVENFYHFWI